MRIKYNIYSYKHGDMPCDNDLGMWLQAEFHGGIEEQLRKMRDLTILLAEDMLTRNPEKINEVVGLLGASGTDHMIVTEEQE